MSSRMSSPCGGALLSALPSAQRRHGHTTSDAAPAAVYVVPQRVPCSARRLRRRYVVRSPHYVHRSLVRCSRYYSFLRRLRRVTSSGCRSCSSYYGVRGAPRSSRSSSNRRLLRRSAILRRCRFGSRVDRRIDVASIAASNVASTSDRRRVDAVSAADALMHSLTAASIRLRLRPAGVPASRFASALTPARSRSACRRSPSGAGTAPACRARRSSARRRPAPARPGASGGRAPPRCRRPRSRRDGCRRPGLRSRNLAIGESSPSGAISSILVFGSVMNTVVTPCSGCGTGSDTSAPSVSR